MGLLQGRQAVALPGADRAERLVFGQAVAAAAQGHPRFDRRPALRWRWIGVPDDGSGFPLRVNDHDGGFPQRPRARVTGSQPFANAVVRVLSIAASDRPAEHIDPTPQIVPVGGVATEHGRAEIPIARRSAGRVWPRRVLPEEGPNIEILYPTIPMDEVPGRALTETQQHQAIPVKVTRVGFSAKEALKILDRELGEPVEMFRLNRLPRPIRFTPPHSIFLRANRRGRKPVPAPFSIDPAA